MASGRIGARFRQLIFCLRTDGSSDTQANDRNKNHRNNAHHATHTVSALGLGHLCNCIAQDQSADNPQTEAPDCATEMVDSSD